MKRPIIGEKTKTITARELGFQTITEAKISSDGKSIALFLTKLGEKEIGKEEITWPY